MEELKLFNNPEFGTIRVISIEDEPWLVGKDVAEALGYANPRKALDDHVDAEDKMQGDTPSVEISILPSSTRAVCTAWCCRASCPARRSSAAG